MSEAKWAVEIQKTSLDQRNLTDLLAGLRFRILDGVEYPALTSKEMDCCSTAADAFEMAKRVRSAFNGPAQIDMDFQLGSVIDYSSHPPKRHAFLEVQSTVMKMTAGNVTLTVGPPKGLKEEELEAWHKAQAEREYQAKLERQRARLEPAFRSERAAKVLKLLSEEEPSGETIYKIYELVEGHPRHQGAFHQQFGILIEEFGRFQDAVHNPAVTGDWARHAYDDLPRSERPMSKSEAERFVRQIAAKWLNHVRKSGCE
jgi:hypothetical protein